MPEQNHLVIGLGGTGCAVVRDLHKQLFVEWNNRQQNAGDKKATGASNRPDVYEFNQQIGQEQWKVRVATLSVDSNEAELTGGADRWRVLGEQITLKDTEIYLLQKKGITQMMSNLSKYPGVEPWVEKDRELFDEITRGSGKPEGCDQIRRLGRLVLADRDNLKNGLLAKVTKRLEKLREGGVNDVTLHLCATLGCGTGSGILVDTIAQLRKMLAVNAGNFPIFLYLFITGDDVKADVGNFHANQYAALKELNAMRLGDYMPWDISNESEAVRIKVQDAFQSCFLISGVSEGNQVLSLDEQVNSVGEFLFQKFARLVGNMPNSLLKAHSFEDLSAYTADNLGNTSGRSTRFASFGIKRLGIPDQEIHKKLALTFSGQGTLALVYANWDSQIGFAKARKSGFDSDKFVLDNLSSWSISSAQLSLNESPGYHPYDTDWKSVSDDIKTDTIATTTDYRVWSELYRSMMEEFSQKGFRGTGLDNFFKPKTEDSKMADRARELVGGLERSMLDGWLFGKEHFITDNLAVMVSTLRGQIERFQQAFKERQTALVTEKEKQTNLRDYNDGELQNVGTATAYLTKKHHDIFHAYCEASRVLYTLQTEERAASYAIGLIDKILPLLDGLRGRVEGVDTLFKKLADEWTEESSALLKKPDKGDAKATDADLIYYVDHEEIAQTIKTLMLDKQAADSQTRGLRSVLDQQRGQTHDFAFVTSTLFTDAKSNRVTGSLRNQMERASYAVSHEAHKIHEQKLEAGFKPVLRLNIVKKLHDDHGGVVSDELKSELRKLMAQAMPSLAFDGSAQPVEHPVPSAPVHRCSLFIPHCSALGESNFRDQLCNELKSMQGSRTREIEIYDVPEDRNSSEIVFLSTAHFFPLRMALSVVALKKRFEEKLKKDERRTLFLHFGESHKQEIPDLMMKNDSDLRKESLPYLVLAAEIDLLHVESGDEHDDWNVVLGEKDDYGRIGDKIDLGIKCSPEHRKGAATLHPSAKGDFQLPIGIVVLLGAHSEFDTRKLSSLKGKVLAKAKSQAESTSAFNTLKEALKSRSGQVFVARGTKASDPLYQLFDSAVSQATGILDSLR